MPERPPKPATQLPTAATVPEPLRSAKRWVGWTYWWDESKEKWKKPPCSALTKRTENWEESCLPLDEALAGAERNGLDGVGFYFAEGDGFVGVDFDDCVLADGSMDPEVATFLRLWFSEAYAEWSPSGTGVHVIFLGRLAKAVTAKPFPKTKATVEAYSKGRYFTWTGRALEAHGRVGGCQTGLDRLLREVGENKAGQPLPGEGGAERAMTALTARAIHQDNLAALRNARQGEGNNLLNTSAFFAARAHRAGALEQTEAAIRAELLRIVTEEWREPHGREQALKTIDSGWASGLQKELPILEDEFPEKTEAVEFFNSKFFIVGDMGGKLRICRLAQSEIAKGQSLVLKAQPPYDFMIRYGDKIQVGLTDDGNPKLEGKGKMWLSHPHRVQYDEVCFLPGLGKVLTGPKDTTMLNLWQGFAYKPVRGDCSLYLAHVRDNICKGDKVKYAYLTGWMAYAIRHPGEQGHVAIVVKGLKGVGKNVFAEAFAALWDGHALVVSDGTHITNNFNAHLRALCVLIADEAFFAGDRRHEGKLKALITGDTIAIEAKGVDVVNAPNLLHIIMLSNERWVVPATWDERRFLALGCSDSRRGDVEYFKAIKRQLSEQGGYEALLHHLMYEVDLRGFDVRQAPHTEELQDQMVESLRDADRVWFDCLYTGLAPGKLQKNGQLWMRTTDFIDWAAQKDPSRWGGLRPQHVGNLLGANAGDPPGFGFGKPRTLTNGGHLRFWMVPPLKDARKAWDDLRFKYDWPEDGGEWDTPGDLNF